MWVPQLIRHHPRSSRFVWPTAVVCHDSTTKMLCGHQAATGRGFASRAYKDHTAVEQALRQVRQRANPSLQCYVLNGEVVWSEPATPRSVDQLRRMLPHTTAKEANALKTALIAHNRDSDARGYPPRFTVPVMQEMLQMCIDSHVHAKVMAQTFFLIFGSFTTPVGSRVE